MRQTTPQLRGNYIGKLYTLMGEFPTLFRDRICMECSWSLPTFYRKTRFSETLPAPLSNAEVEKIQDVMTEMLESMEEENKAYFKQHRKPVMVTR
ncbi:hypothetical protein ACE38W_20300 [Chitinophaga sp. Hz27]|uniref:hypothetical protein n=1 Tax=Chitinophaga sp. Hz27 TaxID=3347169 RepID=UPI0035E15427